MILTTFPTKKLYRTALYTSPLIAILLSAPSAIRMPSAGPFFSMASLFTVFAFIIWTFNIAIASFVEKRHFKKQHLYIRYIVSFIFCMTLTVFTRHILKSLFPIESELRIMQMKKDPEAFYRGRLIASMILGFCFNMVVVIIQDLILLREKKAIVESENAQLKIKNIEATNQQLKQQIHPHFLFNSLNTLKSLIKKNPDIAQDYLIKLSEFLRSSLSSGNNNTIKIDSELKLCVDYLDMQKMRFNGALRYDIDIPENIRHSGFLPSFSLQLLAENALKHNALTNDAPLIIKITYDAGRIFISNNTQPKLTIETSTGIGLSNLTERYRILSNDELTIKVFENTFIVSLKVLDK